MISEKVTDTFDLVILAGGAASRLGKTAAQTPKSMLSVSGQPFLIWQLAELARTGKPRRVFITVRKGTVHVFKDLANKTNYPIEIIEEDSQLGTGGAILNALKLPGLSDPFIVANGDVLFRMNVPALLASARTNGAAIATVMVPDASRFGQVTVAGDKVVAFHERGMKGSGLINAGLYAFTKPALRGFAGTHSFETDIAPGLVRQGKLASVPTISAFIDIGTPETLQMADTFVKRFAT